MLRLDRSTTAISIDRIAPATAVALVLTASSGGQTFIPTGGTVTLPTAAGIGPLLQFGNGGTGAATLQITGGGAGQTFSGAWAIDGANPIFDLAAGVTLIIQPATTGQAEGSPSLLQLRGGGNLVLGQNSYLPGWSGGLSIGDGGTLTIGDRNWLVRSSQILMGTDNSDTTLRYAGSQAVTFSGGLQIGNIGFESTIDVSKPGGATVGDLALRGTVQGGADLRILNSAGLVANNTVTLGFTSGFYTGKLILDGARVQLDTANGIGTAGLEVASRSVLTLGNSMTTGTAQDMTLASYFTLRGATGLEQLTWNGDINLGTLNILTLQQMQLTMGSGSSLTGTVDEGVELGSGGILSLNGITSAVSILGSGGLLAGPGTVGQIGIPGTSQFEGFNGTIQFGNGITRGVLTTVGDAHLANAFVESVMYASSGTADMLQAGVALTGVAQSQVDVIYNATISGGPMIPAVGTFRDYTIFSAGTMPNEVPQDLALTIIDPLNNQFAILFLDPTNPNTTAAGAQFEWITTPGVSGTGVLRITGAPNPTITGPGSTQTNIGTVNNTQLVTMVNQINAISQGSSQTADSHYVAATLLLLSPQVLPGAVVTAAVAANPDALPNTTFNGMSQAGRVAKLRLMELRDGGMGKAAAQANGQNTYGASNDADDPGFRTCALDQLTPAADTAMQPSAVSEGINGATPREGARVWGRGYGFYENVNGQSFAQGDYNAAMGGMMFGADAALDGGLLAGAFAGFTPGDLSIQSTLGNTQVSLMGLNFGGYASWAPPTGATYVQGYAMAGYNAADQSRNIQIPGLVRTATSSANVWGAMVGAEGGLNLRLGEKAVLQPFASLDYGYYTRGSYNETGAGSLNLSVSSQDANLLQPMGGARVMQSFDLGGDRLTPYLGAAFVAQVPLGSWSESATNGFSGAQVFTYGEGADDQYGASFEAGLEFATVNRWTAYISFNGMAMTDTTVYGGQIGISIPF